MGFRSYGMEKNKTCKRNTHITKHTNRRNKRSAGEDKRMLAVIGIIAIIYVLFLIQGGPKDG